MSGLDFSIHGLADAGNGVMIPRLGRDDQSFVEFFRGSRLSKFKSDAAGKPVYDPIDMVRVIQPGEKDINCQEANLMHKRRWPRQWEAYQKGLSQVESGTPLDLLFPSSPDAVNELKAAHVYTVEQLANLTDTAMNMIPMGRTLAQKAQAYLQQASGGSAFHAMEKQMAEMKALIEGQAAMIEMFKAERQVPKRGPGRPPKNVDEAAMADLNESRAASSAARKQEA